MHLCLQAEQSALAEAMHPSNNPVEVPLQHHRDHATHIQTCFSIKEIPESAHAMSRPGLELAETDCRF